MGMPCNWCAGCGGLRGKFGHMQSFSIKDLRNVAGIQVAVGSAVAVVLSVAFSNTGPAIARYILLAMFALQHCSMVQIIITPTSRLPDQSLCILSECLLLKFFCMNM